MSNFIFKRMLYAKFTQAHAAYGRGIRHLLWWLFLNVISAKELFKICLYFTAASVVPCGGRKKFPCTSSIVQIIFYFSPLRSEDIF